MNPVAPDALQPWTHVAAAVNASEKHVFAVELHPTMHGAVVPAGIPGQVATQSVWVPWQFVRAVCIAVTHAAWHCLSPAAQFWKHAAPAVRACMAQALRPRAQLLLHS
jgi:hypothetical protein